MSLRLYPEKLGWANRLALEPPVRALVGEEVAKGVPRRGAIYGAGLLKTETPV